MTRAQSEVTVVGAGMVGCVAACLFARHGFRVTLVSDKPQPDWRIANRESRVSALNLAAVNLLQHLQVWQSIAAQRAAAFARMHVWEHAKAARDADIRFDAAEINRACLGYIVENDLVVHTLLEKLRHNYQARILFDTQLKNLRQVAGGVELQLQQAQAGDAHWQTELLVGADGGDSQVARLLQIARHAQDFMQDAITTLVQSEKPHADTARQCFEPSGPAALLPLSGGDCALVWSCERTRALQLMEMSAADFAAEVEHLFGAHLGRITTPHARARFALWQRHADTYIAPHAALVGDAAHTTHPLAGLGANLGLLDAAVLAESAARARAAGKMFHSRAVLRRYERRRRSENAWMLRVMVGFKYGFGSRRPAHQWLRGAGLNLVDRLPPVKSVIAEFACGLRGDLPQVCREGAQSG